MKKAIFVISCVSIFLVACSKNAKEELDSINSNPISKTVTVEDVGDLHNGAMVVALSTMESADSNDSDEEIMENVLSEMKLYLMDELDIDESEYEGCLSESGLDLSSNATEFYQDLSARTEETLILIEESNSQLAADLDEFIYESEFSSLSELETLVSNLRSAYENDPDYADLVEIVGVVALSSYSYWSGNYGEWEDGPESYNGVWQADVSGAVIGGTWGAVTGSFAGGIGALPGGLLGGCIAASYGSAAAGLWSYFN